MFVRYLTEGVRAPVCVRYDLKQDQFVLRMDRPSARMTVGYEDLDQTRPLGRELAAFRRAIHN